MALKTILGLYVNEKNGKRHMGGKTREAVTIPANTRYMIFKNEDRKSDKHPEYRMVIAIDDEEQPSPNDDADFT